MIALGGSEKSPKLRRNQAEAWGGQGQHRFENQPDFAVPPLPYDFIFSFPSHLWGEKVSPLVKVTLASFPVSTEFLPSAFLSESHLCSFHSATIFPFPHKYAPSCPTYKCFCSLIQARLLSPLLSTAMSLWRGTCSLHLPIFLLSYFLFLSLFLHTLWYNMHIVLHLYLFF